MSDQDPTRDPFAAFGNDRTVIKPSAGRGPRQDAPTPQAPQQPQANPAQLASGTAPLSIDALMGASINPLVAAAQPLLAAAVRLRATARHANPAGLKDALADGVRKFEAQARQQGIPNEQIVAARYILCTFIDESAASTPWGGSGAWSAQSLLVMFHNETWGGEKVFQLMSKLAENVAGNRNLLELLYLVMALGFEGRYRVLDNGRAQLDSVRSRLLQMLNQQRETPDKMLSPRWQGEKSEGQRLRDAIPLWVIMTAVAVLLAIVFMVLRFSLASTASPVFAQMAALDAKKAQMAAPTLPAPQPRLAQLLQNEIAAGLVQVSDLADRSIVIIKGDGFFEPGSAVIAPAVRSLLPHIAEGMKPLTLNPGGTVLITGHTDNQPIRTLRYPSNWHLSQDRADAVKNELAKILDPKLLKAEGRADAEPVAENDTPANRAKNRRVELTLLLSNKGSN
ncbi:MAG: DotU family type VI secretion system protein [Paucibacter sp.]|nr:DotU family type VI secretion system protein [Roseateles sp.]